MSQQVTLRRINRIWLNAGAIESGTDVLGSLVGQAGKDIAKVEAEVCCLDARHHAPFPLPCPGFVSGLSKAPHGLCPRFGAAHADIINGPFHEPREYGVSGEPEYEVDTVRFAPVHHLRPAIVAVAADVADEAAQMVTDFVSRWCLAGTQDHVDRATGGSIPRSTVSSMWSVTASGFLA